mmetsp:Transcript_17082/g.59923  ORF Transcript_17082/g.59923 Transcript_17082/m.59923 type:complete len:205 (-) Transcript_17082:387-1001(-)
MAAALKPRPVSVRSMLAASRLYSTKTRMRFLRDAWYFSSSLNRRDMRASGASTSTICFTEWLADRSSLPTVTRTGSRRNSSAILRISGGHVALNMSVWRSRPMREMMRRMSRSKPMSSMRSASSSTRYVTRSSVSEPSSMRSSSRPGVALTMCTPARSALRCSCFGMPPNTHVLRTSTSRPRSSHTLAVCSASSRVGTRIMAWM